MWLPSLPLYIPSRQATAEEQSTLEQYILRDITQQTASLPIQFDIGALTPEQRALMMKEEIGSQEVYALIRASIIVVFDWQHYQTHPLVPRHDTSQRFAKVMCVFWKGSPNQGDLFIWEMDGTFHRLSNSYSPEDRLSAWVWQTAQSLF